MTEILKLSPQLNNLPPKQQFLFLTLAEDNSLNKHGLFAQYLNKILKKYKDESRNQ